MRIKNEIWIAAGLRTPFAKADKELNSFSALDMSKEVLNKMKNQSTQLPNMVVWGSVVPTLKYSNLGREIVMDSDLPEETIGFSTVFGCEKLLEFINFHAFRSRRFA